MFLDSCPKSLVLFRLREPARFASYRDLQPRASEQESFDFYLESLTAAENPLTERKRRRETNTASFFSFFVMGTSERSSQVNLDAFLYLFLHRFVGTLEKRVVRKGTKKGARRPIGRTQLNFRAKRELFDDCSCSVGECATDVRTADGGGRRARR